MTSNAITQQSFYFVRHGQTECNRQRIFTGRTDIPINAQGVQQAQAAGRLLRHHPIVSICSSPMKRARQTTDAICQQLDLKPPIFFEDNLREVCMGTLEGAPVWEQEAMVHWLEGRITVAGAETAQDFHARVARGVNAVLQRPHPVLIVAHSAVYRAVRKCIGLAASERLENGQIAFFRAPTSAKTSWAAELITQ